MLQHFIVHLLLHYLSSGQLQVQRLKLNENIKLSALKVVAVLMRGGDLQEVPNVVI